MTTQFDAPSNLDGCYVVFLYDPDFADTSPWSVRADSRAHAIRLAINLWHACWSDADGADDDETDDDEADDDEADDDEEALPDPEVTKVYEGSWIGQIIACSVGNHAANYLCPPSCGDPA